MDLLTELKKLNLSDKEASVYLSLLSLGPATPYQVAKKAHMKRPTAYVIIELLVDKNLVVQVLGEKKRTYIARSPEAYVLEAEKKIAEVKQVLPELIALQKKTSEQPNILYFDGLSGLKNAYEYRLKDFHGTEIIGFAARPDDFNPKFLSTISFPWHAYREAHNIRLRFFTVDTKKLASFKSLLENDKTITAKYLPESIYNSDTTLEFFSWGIRIVLVEAQQAIIIESSKLASTFLEIFELLWDKCGSEYDTPENLSLSNPK